MTTSKHWANVADLLALSDDLEAGLPAVPDQTPWDPSAGGEPALELDLTPSAAMQRVDMLISSLLLTRTQDGLTKEQLAEVEGRLTIAYRVQSKIIALQVQADLVENYRKLPSDLKLDLLKLMSAHGGLVPKDDKATASPFSLVINMPAAAAAPSTVVEAQAAAPLVIPLPQGTPT